MENHHRQNFKYKIFLNIELIYLKYYWNSKFSAHAFYQLTLRESQIVKLWNLSCAKCREYVEIHFWNEMRKRAERKYGCWMAKRREAERAEGKGGRREARVTESIVEAYWESANSPGFNLTGEPWTPFNIQARARARDASSRKLLQRNKHVKHLGSTAIPSFTT